VPDPLLSARDIRETFARMGMDDAETAALTAGGHTFGKAHGGGDATLVGVAPEGIAQMGFGWISTHGTGMGDDTITSGRVHGHPRRRSGHDLFRHAARP
jgi:catalase-peroxidase